MLSAAENPTFVKQGKAKGTVFVHLREYVQRTHGERAWLKVREGLPAEDRRTLDELVIVGGWYPVGIWNRALALYLPANHSNPEDGMRKLAAYIAENDLNKLYKMILSMGSPEFLLRRTASLWSRYFDVGDFEATELANKKWRLTLTCPREPEAAPDFYTCGPGVSAWIENGLKLTGTTAKVDHAKCRFYASPRCEYEVTW